MAITAQTIYNRVRETLSLPFEDEVTYSPAAVLTYINEALGFIEITEEIYFQLEPGVRRYELPETWLETQTVTLGSTPMALLPFNMRQLAQAGAQNISGRPTHYAEEGQNILFNPVPSTADTVAVYGRMNPPEVTALEDPINLAKAYTDALRFYVVAMCLSRENDPQTNTYFELWNAMLAKATVPDVRKRNRQFMQANQGNVLGAHFHQVRRR